MTRQEAFDEINKIQDSYIDKLISIMDSPEYVSMKAINFTSPTGTGKTKMMSKLINRFPDYYFIVTTLSKGQLHFQIRDNLVKDCNQDNFYVYGSSDYKINSRLHAEDIISRIPEGTKCIWLRDEGHIKTNRFDELLANVCYKIVNFSATNIHSDIQCNFIQTMMLRTVNQNCGTPEDAIKKLLEVKEAHKYIPNYNPCAIFRCVGGDEALYKRIVSLCEKYKLKYIDITEDDYIMAELCEDDNEYDVLINKFKIVEGIDIRRAHILYMDNQPKNVATTIQVIGRCRRNALLYRDDVDILSSKNKTLLENTRKCFVYYNVKEMKVDTDISGELQYAFCDHISCEALNAGTTISVTKGQLANGLFIIELEGKTGKFDIVKDENIGCNKVNPSTDFYKEECKTIENDEYIYGSKFEKIKLSDIPKLPLIDDEYKLHNGYLKGFMSIQIDEDVFDDFQKRIKENLESKYPKAIKLHSLDYFFEKTIKNIEPVKIKEEQTVEQFLEEYQCVEGYKTFCNFIKNIATHRIEYNIQNYQVKKLLSIGEIELLSLVLIQKKKEMSKNNIVYSLANVKDFVDSFLRLKIKSIPYTQNDKKSYEITEKLLSMSKIYLVDKIDLPCFPIETKIVDKKQIDKFLREIWYRVNLKNTYFVNADTVVRKFGDEINKYIEQLKQHKVFVFGYLYTKLFHYVERKESNSVGSKNAKYYPRITNAQYEALCRNVYKPYIKIYNDEESASIGVDLMQQSKNDNGEITWIESRAVSKKVTGYNKFNAFLSRKYKVELEQASTQCFTGENHFSFNKRCNSVLGYCVEYYSKYLVYGKSYLEGYLRAAEWELRNDEKTSQDIIAVRACMLKYKDLMKNCYGSSVAKVIQSISITELIKKDYEFFVKTVIELGTKTADFVKENLYKDKEALNNIDPNLSIKHITGLADYITEDIILDVKVLNHIDEKCVKQVLAYHYLSTKRSDLHIKKVMIFDATSGKSVVIDISNENLKGN